MTERTIILCTEVKLVVADGLFPAEGITDDDILEDIQNQAEAWVHDDICGTYEASDVDATLFADEDADPPDSIGTFEVCETWVQPDHEAPQEGQQSGERTPLPHDFKAEVTHTIERDPGLTFKTALNNITIPHEVGHGTRIINGRYRGIQGFIHEINGGLVTVRTGDPEEWARREAR